MRLNISQFNKNVQQHGPELQFQLIKCCKGSSSSRVGAVRTACV